MYLVPGTVLGFPIAILRGHWAYSLTTALLPLGPTEYSQSTDPIDLQST